MRTMELTIENPDSLSIEETFSKLWEVSKLALQAAASGRSADLHDVLDVREHLIRRATELAAAATSNEIALVQDYARRIEELDPEFEALLKSQVDDLKEDLGIVRSGRALARRYQKPNIRRRGAIFRRDA